MGQLLEKGLSIQTKDHFMDIFNSNARRILKAPLSQNRTFQVQFHVEDTQCFSAELLNDDHGCGT
jgi:hypothetical protein